MRTVLSFGPHEPAATPIEFLATERGAPLSPLAAAVLALLAASDDDPRYLPPAPACPPWAELRKPNTKLDCIVAILTSRANAFDALMVLRQLPGQLGQRTAELRPALRIAAQHWILNVRSEARRVLAGLDHRPPPEAACIATKLTDVGALTPLPQWEDVSVPGGPCGKQARGVKHQVVAALDAHTCVVSDNAGEWGSRLRVLVDGKDAFSSRHSLMNPTALLAGPDGWFVVESLAHMDGFGAVSWLQKSDQGWSLKRIVQLPGTVTGYRLEGARLLVTSNDDGWALQMRPPCICVVSVAADGDVRLWP